MTVDDDTMRLIVEAYDAAWMASGAWNRNMSAFPPWKGYLSKHDLTQCYQDWFARTHPEQTCPVD